MSSKGKKACGRNYALVFLCVILESWGWSLMVQVSCSKLMNHELEATLLHLFALYKQVLQILVGSYLQSSKISNFGLQVLLIICQRTGSNEKAQENQVDESDDEASHLGRSFFETSCRHGIPMYTHHLHLFVKNVWHILVMFFLGAPQQRIQRCLLSSGHLQRASQSWSSFQTRFEMPGWRKSWGNPWFETSMDIHVKHKHHGTSWNFMINPWETEWKLGILDEFPLPNWLVHVRWRVIFPLFSIFGGCSPHRWLPLHSWSPRHLP